MYSLICNEPYTLLYINIIFEIRSDVLVTFHRNIFLIVRQRRKGQIKLNKLSFYKQESRNPLISKKSSFKIDIRFSQCSKCNSNKMAQDEK